jgi:hypothetical protein
MNRLRDPKVILGLAALVLLLGGGAYWLLGRPAHKSQRAVVPGLNVAASAAASKPADTNADWPVAAIDFGAVKQGLARWTEAPGRDPFQVAVPSVIEVAPATPSPVSQFKLRAIWQQTGGRAAVINDRVLLEGDILAGCKLERIETDRVWFQGPEKRESLIFGQVTPPPPPPRPPLNKRITRGIFGDEVAPPAKPRL